MYSQLCLDGPSGGCDRAMIPYLCYVSRCPCGCFLIAIGEPCRRPKYYACFCFFIYFFRYTSSFMSNLVLQLLPFKRKLICYTTNSTISSKTQKISSKTLDQLSTSSFPVDPFHHLMTMQPAATTTIWTPP
jgi:hypothetical protein